MLCAKCCQSFPDSHAMHPSANGALICQACSYSALEEERDDALGSLLHVQDEYDAVLQHDMEDELYNARRNLSLAYGLLTAGEIVDPEVDFQEVRDLHESRSRQ